MKATSFFTFILSFVLCLNSFSQKKSAILFKIDGTPQLVSDFEVNYNRNNDLIVDSSQQKIKNYLDLYINYKLKVLEAYQLKLDTIDTFKGELSRYKE